MKQTPTIGGDFYNSLRNPPFSFIVDDRWPRPQNIYTTDSVAENFSEDFGEDLSWIPISSHIGTISLHEDEWIIYHPAGPRIGKTSDRHEAAVGLLKLFVQQHRPKADN